MFSSIDSNTTRPDFYDDIEKIWPKQCSSKDKLKSIFENKAFQENPYKFTLGILIDHLYNTNSVDDIPVYVFMIALPNFAKNATIDLIKKIAQERFENHTRSKQIFQAFNSSVNHSAFIKHFELCRDTHDIYNLNTLLRSVFSKALNERVLIVDEEYLEMQEYASSFA